MNNQTIPLVDLKRESASINNEIEAALKGVLQKGQFILGDNVSLFEKEFAEYCSTKYAIGVASGSDALFLSLMALGVGNGDEVITTPFTFISTVDAISKVGAKPIFADIDEGTYNISLPKIKGRITNRTRAIIVVHLYGNPVDMNPVRKLAKSYNLKIVEDACQAHGAEYKGKKVGSLGDTGCFSFYPTKNLGAYGDGGIVTTSNDEIAQKIKILRDHGRTEKNRHNVIGYNSRLDELQAAVLRVKLKYLEERNEQRRKHAQLYNNLLQDIDHVQIPIEIPFAKHVYCLYVIKHKSRDELQEYLAFGGISTMIHYPIPVHLQKAYKYLGFEKGSFPMAEKCASEVLSLPMFSELTQQEIEHICKKLKEFVQ
ncbi:dTDP-3-amino-3,6-dideoxy-alpha-D-galactopyranose transaminase [subsurface metagenome]